jgi:hypothetical protein
MPITGGAVPVIGIVLLLMFAGGKKKKGAKPSCPPFTWLDEEIDQAIVAGIDADICEAGELTANVADVIYPMTPDGAKIDWPKTPPWRPPADAAESVVCIWGDIMDRVNEHLANLPPGACEGPGPTPQEIIRPYIARPGKPEPGKFYRLRKGDTFSWLTGYLANRLGLANKVPVMHCITDSEWNLTYYGTPWDPNGPKSASGKLHWPKYTAVDVDNVLMVMMTAFYPRHQNAMSEMYNGRLPERAIDSSEKGRSIGVPNSSSYGMLWIPMMAAEDGVLLCPEDNWEDGRPQTEPPPEILELLE